jgi:Ser-tRNA(Ala) deacylase AlaX
MIGGGQPTDTGHLSTLDPNGGVQKTYVVEGCLRRKLTAVHLVRLGEGEELESGAEVELTIDWDRRADHVSLHLGGGLTGRWQSTQLSTYCPPSSIHMNYQLYHGQ